MAETPAAWSAAAASSALRARVHSATRRSSASRAASRRSTAAEALRGDVDDVGAEAAHVLVVEAPLADHVATVVLDDDVGRGAEAERQLAAARGTEIERDAQLPARGIVEGPRAVDGVGL